jgi:hypothetical protein
VDAEPEAEEAELAASMAAELAEDRTSVEGERIDWNDSETESAELAAASVRLEPASAAFERMASAVPVLVPTTAEEADSKAASTGSEMKVP